MFSQTEFDTSSSAEVSRKRNLATPQRIFSNTENFLNEFSNFSTLHPSLKNDDDDEISSAAIDLYPNNVHVTYAHTEMSYWSSSISRPFHNVAKNLSYFWWFNSIWPDDFIHWLPSSTKKHTCHKVFGWNY